MHCIHIYYGEGKGKTTAAIGAAIRAKGADKKVCIVRFLKSSDSSEVDILKKSDIDVCDADMQGFYPLLNDEEKVKAAAEQKALLCCQYYDKYDFVVFDELLNLFDVGIVSEEEILSLIDEYKSCEIILTGRKCSDKLLERAHYVTYMQCKKHPYNEFSLEARKGIEY